MVQYGLHLNDRDGFSPIRKLHDRPDLLTFTWSTFDAEMIPQPRRLPGYPRRVVGMPEASMVRHDAKYIDVLGLCFEIDRKFVAQRTIEFGIGPRAMECAEQGLWASLVEN